ncbi:[protein-PII] uridylyltransferase [Oryzihumus leptocrescens]|uniref:Bifunctional uridylyltransferase/uridylyl-removing enzyme n=2 Tax=Oryzihumus leptocrescens TaxID=297536 RepID=A0A542ZLI8_9MICO|nr:[protein-PII] uridylyltransferase [Oryzihumus leptocrescens]
MGRDMDLAAQRLDLAGTRSFGAPGAGRRRRTALADFARDQLQGIWAEATKGGRFEGVALASVGSLARGDGGPLSDYDLVLLHYGRSLSEGDVTELADRVWYPIWDGGAKLDHSVRTVNQCRQVAAADLSAAVGLLDLTWVAGDREVVQAASATLAHDWRANARRRLPELVESLETRHRRHGDLAHVIEPDLKEARGGLRDMTVLRALTAAWLADRPHGAVDTAYEHLLDVRDALHVVTGRGRDRLTREDHDAVAALLGEPDADAMLTEVATSARTIAFALDATVRRAGQSQRARTLRIGPRRPQLNPLGYGLFEHDGELVLGPSVDPARDPLLALRAAVLAARNNLPISPATLANLAEHSAPLSEPWSVLARSLFADLLAAGPGLIPVWEGLDLAGVVERWIPEWADVRSRPQRNPVHRHTVDRHLVETVVQAKPLLRDVERPDLLLLAALLHDIGKVAGAHDHSTVGAPVAARVAARMGLPQREVDLVTLLVREHLTLIDLATRRDPQDPQTVAAVVDAVGGERAVLELLRALTEADACAAGPAAWTDWRAQLLDRLTGGVRAALGDETARPVPDELDGPLSPEVITSVVAGEPHVEVTSVGGVHRLDVYDRDRLGLFADTAGLLASHGLVVRTAVVRTLDGIAANEWHVESPGGDVPDGVVLARGLFRLARGDRAPLMALERRRAPRPTASAHASSGSPGQTRAMVVPQASLDATVIEVRAQDRPGLLHDVGLALAKAGLSVRSAHIATYAGQTLDTFYLTEFAGRALPPARVAQAVSVLIDACDGTGAQGR